ncbi:Alpha/Beta hydrolase protein [Lophiotrema nucula]|uniref:Alpha/Beta hydrolase protein n=1 Tax=Lophiotrema nucula TaxID=690887 RepID=A0A6A5ZQM5_9PLEO|nr:Alpha/Beta hydrolase protein [Lophiotrema nucula]
MPLGPFALQWRAPRQNPPQGYPLPEGILRSYIEAPSGPLELLSAIPAKVSNQTPLFFQHGGFGCAEIWLSFLQYYSSRGIPCYALSVRGHGNSWYQGFWRMYFTTRARFAEDVVTSIEHVEALERKRRGNEEKVKVVLVAHSAGGALSQYILSRGMAKVQGFCMFAAVPGFGSASCYNFWALTAPLHFPYRLFHPRYILANTKQVHEAFFMPSTPTSVVKHLERLLSPYESMLWPMQMIPRVVTGPDVLSSIVGWSPRQFSKAKQHDDSPAGVAPRLLVLAAEHDVLCTPALSLDAAQRYRVAFQDLAGKKKLEGISSGDLRTQREQGSEWDGVAFKVVPGVAHHMQNEVEWEKGAMEVLAWSEQL